MGDLELSDAITERREWMNENLTVSQKRAIYAQKTERNEKGRLEHVVELMPGTPKKDYPTKIGTIPVKVRIRRI